MEAGVGVGEGGGRKSGLPSKKMARQHRTILFVDESGFYLLPHVGRTWAPRGERPILKESGSRRKAHLSVAAAISP